MLLRALVSSWIVLAIALLSGAVAHAQVPRFDGVGDLVGGATQSHVSDLSADGSIAVGESEGASGSEAIRWTLAGGIEGLGFLSLADPYSSAHGISADGSVIAGSSHDGSGVLRAYRWSASTMTALATLSCSDCDPVTEGLAISADGLVVVGAAASRSGGTGPLNLDCVRWPAGGTSIFDLGNLSGGTGVGAATGVSLDGSVIAGNHMSGNGKDAWYWTGSGLNALPTLTGGSIIAATATAVSDDGSTIVGYSNQDVVTLPGGSTVATKLQAVRWLGAGFTTLESLGSLPGAVSVDSAALAVSADGSIVVGRAVDASVSDRAFIWDATNGMQDLKAVLTDDYGLDLTGWVLSEATAISAVVAGTFSVAGNGINPMGEEEGWVAFLTTPACSDGLDNDSDFATDHPADTGCRSPVDASEEPDCSDSLDNDGDGDSDHPNDPDCLSATDPSEEPDCSDGLDNDGDGLFDHPEDPGCASPSAQREDPACSDGLDNDGDLATDHPADVGCQSPSDLSEVPDCSDGLDNDGDGLIDVGADPECESALDPSENAQCSDGIDNDGDGVSDYPAQYPGCIGEDDPIEAPQCSDGIDNDGDGFIDHPSDPECSSALAASESPVAIEEGDLIVVDRTSRAVFRVDAGTGAQALISEKASMQAPQGIAARWGEIVVADPAGLIAIDGSGQQRLASAPLTSNESLQVVIDPQGDAFILEADGIHSLAWNPTGLGVKTLYIAIPTSEPIPVLGLLHGDTLAQETSGDLITTSISLYGDGVFRVDHLTQQPTILLSGFHDLQWLDLAVEADGTILAVGFKFDVLTGVYRVDPVTGVATLLNDSHGWQRPTGVAVASDGAIYVADAGVCADGICAGGEIVHVDPGTGVATSLSSGGFIAGEMDVTVVPEPGLFSLLVSGALWMIGLERVRARRTAHGAPASHCERR